MQIRVLRMMMSHKQKRDERRKAMQDETFTEMRVEEKQKANK